MGLMFGADESIECITSVTLKGAKGEPLCLAFKTTKVFVGGGVYLKDDGYVLMIVKEHGSYYPMPAADEVESFQAQGLLPSPLPHYKVPIIEYLFGYSLWIVIVFAI